MQARFVTTRKQRESVYSLFKRHYWEQLPKHIQESLATKHYFSNPRKWFPLYRAYRKRFQFAGFGNDVYLFGQPYEQGEGMLWVGIESDGYTHS